MKGEHDDELELAAFKLATETKSILGDHHGREIALARLILATERLVDLQGRTNELLERIADHTSSIDGTTDSLYQRGR